MSKLRDDSNLLTTELLKKYRNGTLSSDEEAQLAALRAQDPFIAGALDGIRVASDGESFATDVATLRARLPEKARRPQRSADYTLWVAASLVLLLIASYLIYEYVLDTNLLPVAHKTRQPSSTTSEDRIVLPLRPLPIPSLTPIFLADTLYAKLPTHRISALVQIPTVSTEPSSRSFYNSPEETEPNTLNREVMPIKPLPRTEAEPEKVTVSPRANYSRPRVSSNLAAKDTYTVTGQVTDRETGDVLPGVNVLVKGTQQGAITDIDGNYQIKLTPGQETLVYSFIGYATKEKQATSSQYTEVALEADLQSLSEVVVTGYGRTEFENNFSTTSARPYQGMRAFKKYLRDSARYPDNPLNREKETVNVAFSVLTTGQLSNFTVVKSAGAWFDEEAIRLIREGPGWQAATRNGNAIDQRIITKVHFR